MSSMERSPASPAQVWAKEVDELTNRQAKITR